MKSQRVRILNSVKALREARGLSQETMADLMKMSQSAYARFESGRSKTDLEILEVFCHYAKLSLIELFYYPDEVPTNDNSEVKAQLTIELKADKRDQVLKLVFGDNNLEILNK